MNKIKKVQLICILCNFLIEFSRKIVDDFIKANAEKLTSNGYKISAAEIKNLEEIEYYNNVEVNFRNDYWNTKRI